MGIIFFISTSVLNTSFIVYVIIHLSMNFANRRAHQYVGIREGETGAIKSGTHPEQAKVNLLPWQGQRTLAGGKRSAATGNRVTPNRAPAGRRAGRDVPALLPERHGQMDDESGGGAGAGHRLPSSVPSGRTLRACLKRFA